MKENLKDVEDSISYIRELLENNCLPLFKSLLTDDYKMIGKSRFGSVHTCTHMNHQFVRIGHTPILQAVATTESVFSRIVVVPTSNESNMIVLTGYQGSETSLYQDVSMAL